MNVGGILETALYVADPSRSAEFYRRLFGFPTLLESDRLIALARTRYAQGLGAQEEPVGEPVVRHPHGTGEQPVHGVRLVSRAAAVGDRWVTGLPREVLVPRPVTFGLKAASSTSVPRCWTTHPDGSRLQRAVAQRAPTSSRGWRTAPLVREHA